MYRTPTETGGVKRKKPQDPVSPDTLRAEAVNSKSVDVCINCNKRCNTTGKNSEALQCDLCFSWVHASCEGVSKSHYKFLNEILAANQENIFYLCKSNQCHTRLKQLLGSKMSTAANQHPDAANLSTKVDDLATRSEKLEKDLAEIMVSIKELNKPVAKPDSKVSHSNPVVPKNQLAPPNSGSTPDRKFNVVVYGVEECLPNTFKPVRLQKDFDSVSKIFSSIAAIDSSAIMDCYHLGKYKTQHPRPRPILVKLRRTLDINTILANKGSLSSPLIIKPDLSPEERAREAVLLKERWSLLQQGYERKMIKIRNNSIFVNNQLFGQFKNSVFQHCTTTTPVPQGNTVNIPPPIEEPLITLESPETSSAATKNSN